jgi:hypothetical protein
MLKRYNIKFCVKWAYIVYEMNFKKKKKKKIYLVIFFYDVYYVYDDGDNYCYYQIFLCLMYLIHQISSTFNTKKILEMWLV